MRISILLAAGLSACLAVPAAAETKVPAVRPLGNDMIRCKAGYVTPTVGISGNFNALYDVDSGRVGVFPTTLWFDGVDLKTLRKIPWGSSGTTEIEYHVPTGYNAPARLLPVEISGWPGLKGDGGYFSQSSYWDTTLGTVGPAEHYVSLAINIPGATRRDAQNGQFVLKVNISTSASDSQPKTMFSKTLNEWEADVSDNGDVRIRSLPLGNAQANPWLKQQIAVWLYYRGQWQLTKTFNPQLMTAEASRIRFESQILGKPYMSGALPSMCMLEPIKD